MSNFKPIFDWTINLGHILTFIGFLIAGFAAVTTIDKRLVVLEQASLYQQRRDADQDQRALDAKSEVRDALKDMRTSVDRLSDRIERK